MIFLRHPSPNIASGTCYGRTNMDIAQIGHTQIEEALVTTPKITKLIASPALRCQKLALSLCERDKIEPIIDERLWEMNMGDFEGQAWSKIDRSLSEIWLSDPMNNAPPNGESFAQVQKRVLSCVIEYMEKTPKSEQNQLAFVCHAGPIRALKMAWQGLTFYQAFEFQPAYATPIELAPA